MRYNREEKLREIKEYIDDYCAKLGYGPSTREIALNSGLSNGMVIYYLKELQGRGSISKGRTYMSNALTEISPMLDIPVLGAIPCGNLEEIEEYAEDHIQLPRDFVGKGKYFFLRASGDSMIGAGIESGDLVLIKQTDHAESGKIVAALSTNAVTLKRLKFDGKRYYLHPENDSYEDIYPDTLEIQGIAVKVIKDIR